jgi:Domain of unknown function (DUF1918)
MEARIGQCLVVRARRQGEPDRDGEILEVRGPAGGPPYVVRWSDNGHVSFIYPGADAYVAHQPHTSTG